jgi:hypothetical protein
MGFFADMAEKKKLEREEKERQATEKRRIADEAVQKRANILEIMKNGGTPPSVVGTRLILQKNEICHFASNATRLITKEKVTGFQARTVGASFRVAKGITLRSGGAKGSPIRQNVTDRFDGMVFITNKRIVFQADRNGFVLPFPKIISIKKYTDGCEYFKDSIAYLLIMPDSIYCNAILECALSKVTV